MKLPIFPLHTVLFPEENLPLRIFEQRYLKMISDCMREDEPFGVSLICGDGAEVGEQVGCFSTGTVAKVADFDQKNGMLNITVKGQEKFNLVSANYQADGLLLAEVNAAGEESLEIMPEAFVGLEKIYCQMLLEQNIESLPENDQEGANQSATSLAFKLSAMAPISNSKKQKLLECPSTIARLKML